MAFIFYEAHPNLPKSNSGSREMCTILKSHDDRVLQLRRKEKGQERISPISFRISVLSILNRTHVKADQTLYQPVSKGLITVWGLLLLRCEPNAYRVVVFLQRDSYGFGLHKWRSHCERLDYAIEFKFFREHRISIG